MGWKKNVNKKSCNILSLGEDQEMKSSSKSCTLMTSSYRKKNKVDWTKDLHNKFLKAIEKLGVDNAVPNKILKLMKVEGLTRDHVASHLQKYRALLKKIADGNYGFQIASKTTLLESSMTYGNQWQTNQVIIHEPKNWPILDTSSSYIYALEASRSNGATQSQLAHSGSLPNQGYYMQSLSNNLDKQWSLNDDAAKLDVVESMGVNSVEFTNSEVIQNRDGYTYAYGGGSTDVNPYNNIEMGSSGGEYSNNELSMSWDHEINLTNTGNFNDVESNNSSQNKNNEMGSLYDFNLNCNLESEIGEDDLMLQEADIASLLSYVNHDSAYGSTSNNQPITPNPQNQNHNEDHVNEHQTLDEYLHGLDPTFNMQHVEPLMEPIWSLEPVTNDMISKGK